MTTNASDLANQKVTPGARKKWIVALIIFLVVLLSSPIWGKGLWVDFFQYRATKNLQARNPESALQWLAYAQSLDDANPRTRILRARSFRKSHDVKQAYEELKAYYQLAGATDEYQQEQWLFNAQIGENADLQRHLSELLINPQGDIQDICETYVNSCVLNYQFNAALQILDLWEADFPEDPLPNFMRGKIYEHSRALKEATDEYQKTLKKDPQYAPAAYSLARVQLTLKKTEPAMQYYETAIANTEYPAPAQVGLARCLRLLNRNEEAKKVLAEVLKKESTQLQKEYQAMGDHKSAANSSAQLEMGNLELAEKNYAAALKWLEPAAQANPIDLAIKNSLALVYSRLGRKQEAKTLSLKIKETNEALEEIQRLLDQIREKPDDAELRYQIGKRYLNYVSEEQGIVWLNSVFRSNPNHGGAHDELARYYEQNLSRGDSFQRLAKTHREQADVQVAKQQPISGSKPEGAKTTETQQTPVSPSLSSEQK
ncbi:tetratricopeptide repeat protein [Gimesia fumaroli]|uniref:Tetratricopeptide repeat protein n=1 Tax=Gimesia fumaroli TaxID=2527976 RepID=A0A518I5A4_9PLAN|nr:tetratricopeptide repeat protein [Gimesia fumaroli]QDV48291.1 tetratricopeptide repeat protein [Gimesia fumaroli]